ncbi:MAG: hypothetical protein COZ70_14400 [Deltaproteobacteria bacterium CG_4_8_14_3_um_filter_51_11]|nr:MAG: hypothetical protein AUK25_10265 [Desulfobacteraceae bacterium CG2_30_51_40]PIX18385.1 MAG: hypothetical protein COZ70_14400 [Deltaproteobacteria bacterium CG_4_8_14_3_um_filter_51_11]PIY26217.1 MAG: hypothetical protein COZ11_03210 [Deltaproteobacteria bacterium CG_4_10_14_3_um_filter_51_14]PJB33834.1 MAG: hypothetical protein CO107_14700 [Deltaproteobacteria bacterium CG_4_9_14_3_um_filter_51_14]
MSFLFWEIVLRQIEVESFDKAANAFLEKAGLVLSITSMGRDFPPGDESPLGEKPGRQLSEIFGLRFPIGKPR